MLEKLRQSPLLFAVPVLCTLVLGLATANSIQIGSVQDDAWYLDTATALARGQGFVRPWTPALASETSLPPGLPVLLAPLRWLFPGSLLPAQLLSLAATLGAVWLIGRYYRGRFEGSLAWLATLFLAVNVGLISFSMQVMAEAVYTFLVMLIVALYQHEEDGGRHAVAVYAAIGLLAAAAYFIRSWGLALVGALALCYLWRRRWLGTVLAVLPCAFGYALLSVRNESAGGVGATYGIAPDTAAPFIARFTDNLPEQLATHWLHDLPQWIFTPRTTFTLDGHGLHWLVLLSGGCVLALVVTGYIVQARQRVSLPEVFVLAHAAIVSVAPLNARYWIPIVPFVVYYLIVGMRAVLQRARSA